MDLDFDLCDDKIKAFLNNKLQEIKSLNAKLETKLSERKDFLKTSLQGNDHQMDETNVKISPEVWKKIFNNKYCFGFSIENNGNSELSDLKLILTWNSSNPLTYKVIIFEELLPSNGLQTFECTSNGECKNINDTIKFSNKIQSFGQLVIVLEIPEFIDQLEYKIQGNVIYQQSGKSFSHLLPTTIISSDELSNRQLHVSLIKNSSHDLLSVVSCDEKTDLVMILPAEWSSSLDSTFEIHCSLTKLQVSSLCKRYFIANNVSPIFDFSMIEIHNVKVEYFNAYHVITHTRNEDSLKFFLHYLHTNIPGCVFLPKLSFLNYSLQNRRSDLISNDLDKLGKCISKEINFVYNFLEETSTHHATSEQTVQFRSNLVDLEYQTDLAYLKIN